MPLEFTKIEATRESTRLSDARDEIGLPEAALHVAIDTTVLDRELLELSALAVKRRRSYLKWQWCLGAFVMSAATLFAAMALFAPHSILNGIGAIVLFAVMFVGLVTIGGYLRGTRADRRLHGLLRSVIAADSTTTTGALIDVLSLDDTRASHLARVQLARLAQRWSEADLAALPRDQRDGLRRIVDGTPTRRHGDAAGTAVEGREKRTGSLDLRIAVCKALARLGNGEDLAPLKRVIALPAATAHARQIKAAAKSALSVLEARLEDLGHPHTLLRASDAPASSPDELMRAATTPNTTRSNELLRPQ